VVPVVAEPGRLLVSQTVGSGYAGWPGRVQMVSMPRTWLRRPKAIHDPRHIDSSTISAWV
jgi:hypothetical protein